MLREANELRRAVREEPLQGPRRDVAEVPAPHCSNEACIGVSKAAVGGKQVAVVYVVNVHGCSPVIVSEKVISERLSSGEALEH